MISTILSFAHWVSVQRFCQTESQFQLMLGPQLEFDIPTFKVNEICSAGLLGFSGDYFASESQGTVSLFESRVQ